MPSGEPRQLPVLRPWEALLPINTGLDDEAHTYYLFTRVTPMEELDSYLPSAPTPQPLLTTKSGQGPVDVGAAGEEPAPLRRQATADDRKRVISDSKVEFWLIDALDSTNPPPKPPSRTSSSVTPSPSKTKKSSSGSSSNNVSCFGLALWQCSATIGQLRPECLDVETYWQLLEEVFRWGRQDRARTTIFPQPLSPQSKSCRVEVKLSARSGAANVTAVVMQCSLAEGPVQTGGGSGGDAAAMLPPHAALLQSISAATKRTAKEATDWRRQKRELIAERARYAKLAQDKVQSEEELMLSFLSLLNAKKAKFNAFVTALNRSEERIVELEAQLAEALAKNATAGVDAPEDADVVQEAFDAPTLQPEPSITQLANPGSHEMVGSRDEIRRMAQHSQYLREEAEAKEAQRRAALAEDSRFGDFGVGEGGDLDADVSSNGSFGAYDDFDRASPAGVPLSGPAVTTTPAGQGPPGHPSGGGSVSPATGRKRPRTMDGLLNMKI